MCLQQLPLCLGRFSLSDNVFTEDLSIIKLRSMKLYATMILLFLMTGLKSQSQRFFYEYHYVTDTTKTNMVSKDLMQLDIFKDHSEFLSTKLAARDSVIFNRKKTNDVGSNLPVSQVRMKTFKGKEIFSVEYIGIEPFKIVCGSQLNWKLAAETKSISGYHCQQASVELFGRKWKAWYTAEIPIQDGPWFFSGLPGLVLEVEDTEGYFSFSYVGHVKIKNSIPNYSFTNKLKAPTLSSDQFNKKWNAFRKNPLGAKEQWTVMNPNLMNIRYYDANGALQNTALVYKEERKTMKKELESNNMFINKDLYK